MGWGYKLFGPTEIIYITFVIISIINENMIMNYISNKTLPICNLWGQRVYDPSPFRVKAQGLHRGDTGQSTHHEIQGRSKEMAEDELLLGMP